MAGMLTGEGEKAGTTIRHKKEFIDINMIIINEL